MQKTEAWRQELALWFQRPESAETQDRQANWMTNQEDAFKGGWDAALSRIAAETQESETRRLTLGDGSDKGGDLFAMAVFIVLWSLAIGLGVVLGWLLL